MLLKVSDAFLPCCLTFAPPNGAPPLFCQNHVKTKGRRTAHEAFYFGEIKRFNPVKALIFAHKSLGGMSGSCSDTHVDQNIAIDINVYR